VKLLSPEIAAQANPNRATCFGYLIRQRRSAAAVTPTRAYDASRMAVPMRPNRDTYDCDVCLTYC
jgi:hypothetical protein